MAKLPFLDKKALSRKLESNHQSIPKVSPLSELEFSAVKFLINFKFSSSLEKLIWVVIFEQRMSNVILTLCVGELLRSLMQYALMQHKFNQ